MTARRASDLRRGRRTGCGVTGAGRPLRFLRLLLFYFTLAPLRLRHAPRDALRGAQGRRMMEMGVARRRDGAQDLHGPGGDAEWRGLAWGRARKAACRPSYGVAEAAAVQLHEQMPVGPRPTEQNNASLHAACHMTVAHLCTSAVRAKSRREIVALDPLEISNNRLRGFYCVSRPRRSGPRMYVCMYVCGRVRVSACAGAPPARHTALACAAPCTPPRPCREPPAAWLGG